MNNNSVHSHTIKIRGCFIYEKCIEFLFSTRIQFCFSGKLKYLSAVSYVNFCPFLSSSLLNDEIRDHMYVLVRVVILKKCYDKIFHTLKNSTVCNANNRK